MSYIPDVDVFLEVFEDVRFPFFAVDIQKLRIVLAKGSARTHFAVSIDAPVEKRTSFVSSFRGLFRQIDVPPQMIALISASPIIRQSGYAQRVLQSAGHPGHHGIVEVGDQLVWEEDSPWPVAYSSFLEQIFSIFSLHRELIVRKIAETARALEAEGFSAENVETLSEYPRQLPTHIHYAAASLGAWIGGAMNVQYFGYFAAIRQITHAELNLQYAERIGYQSETATRLNASGIIALPASLVFPLLKSQGTNTVFGSIPIDESNLANLPSNLFMETMNIDEPRALPGFILDKYYRAPFRARQPAGYAFYGAEDVLRDHYDGFYEDLNCSNLVRCKHYCVPVVDVSSVAELRTHISRIPNRHEKGVFFRGQRRLYLLQRDPEVQKMLFSDSCNVEPSLITSASRHPDYDYDIVHFALKYFLAEKILIQDEITSGDRWQDWRRMSSSPDCRLDSAILALAQHYGLPSHGLDVTDSIDVAIWFATNVFKTDAETNMASYETLQPEDWPKTPSEWPVVVACQCVTHSIQQSLHDCQELAEFGFASRRPIAQAAHFFQGGHSDHQNRLAEAVVCVFRLAPGTYKTECNFDSLFPDPSRDPAYRAMLEFADSTHFGPAWGRYINRFHPRSGNLA